MSDNKRFREVQSLIEIITATLGSVPSKGADGVATNIYGSQSGIMYTVLTDASGNLSVVAEDNAAAPADLGGVFSFAKCETTLPTYVNNDASVLHTDTRGRLHVQLSGPDGNTNVIGEDADAAPTNPDGIFQLGKYQASLPTYTDGDAAVLHTDINGRLLISSSATASSSSLNNVAATTSSTTLLAANAARLGATIYNDSTDSLYVKLGATASTSSFTALLSANSYYEIPFGYVGRIDGIWDGTDGAARVTELTS